MRSFFPWATLFTGTTVAGNHRTDSCCRHFAVCCMDRSLGVQGERPDQILCERLDFLHQFVQETVPGQEIRSDVFSCRGASAKPVHRTQS